MEKKKIKRYRIKVENIENPMDLISLVKDPAIEEKGMYFSKENKYHIKFSDDVKGILVAPALIPDIPIIRYDEIEKEYFEVVFDKEAIEYLVQKFNEKYSGKRINFDHTREMTEGVIIESWLKEFDEDKSNKFGFDLPIGSWFLKIKFENKDWFKKNVIEKEFYGLSVEILADLDFIGEFDYKYDFSEIKFESYNDYPEAAKENAKRAIEKNLELNNKCATQVGKVRAQQIIDGENLSIETIKRTYSYLSRSKEYDNGNWEECGTISYNLWGGDEMLNWSERKLKQIREENLISIIEKLSEQEILEILQEFIVEPNSGESEEEFIGRCVQIEINNGYEQEQALAICYSKWKEK